MEERYEESLRSVFAPVALGWSIVFCCCAKDDEVLFVAQAQHPFLGGAFFIEKFVILTA